MKAVETRLDQYAKSAALIENALKALVDQGIDNIIDELAALRERLEALEQARTAKRTGWL